MRLESALYSSKEGLNANGQAISVVGDNISNANTTGFKASRIEFADLVAEGGVGSQGTANQVSGNGAAVARVRQIQDTGVIESTGRSLDVAIAGRGFLVVGDPDNPGYTRSGSLSFNKDGVLVNADGKSVLGFSADGATFGTLNVNNLNLNGKVTTKANIFGNIAAENPITTTPSTAPTSFRELSKGATYSSTMTVIDSLGLQHTVTLAFYKTASNKWTSQAYIDGADVGDTAGTPVLIGTQNLSFGTDGKIAAADKPNSILTAQPTYSGGAAPGNFTVDLSGFTQFAGSTQVTSIVQDGQPAGNITDYQIEPDGTVYAVLDSGQNLLIGSMRLADFQNVDGLERIGNSIWTEGADSGTRRVEQPGTKGLGTLENASLERSTVDIANQFVELVLYQRGYQANSQTLRATSTLISDTLNLIR